MNEWGPWIEHDGSQKPVPDNVWVEVVFRAPPLPHQGNPFECGGWSHEIAWWWDNDRDDVIRYRIRKPKGLQILEGILREIDTPIKEAAS